MLRLPRDELLGGDRVRQRAAGVGVGDQHALVRTQDRRGLGHEVHAAEDDRLGVGRGGLLGEPERVPDVVGDVLDLGKLVVVGEDDGLARARERAHLVLERSGCSPAGAGRGRRTEHRQVHGSGSSKSERSSAGALCVRAPIEMKSTPGARDLPQPRERHPAARLELGASGDVRDRLAQLTVVHVVEQDPRRPRRERLVDLGKGPALDLDEHAGRVLASATDGGPDTAGERRVVLLDEDGVEQADAVVRAPAGGDRRLLERPQARRRLARVEDPRTGPFDLANAPRGEGRDARELLQEVERRPLGGEDRPGRPVDLKHRPALAPHPLVDETGRANIGIEPAKRFLGDLEPVDDARLLLRDPSARPRPCGNGRLRRQIARADVLAEGAGDELCDLRREH